MVKNIPFLLLSLVSVLLLLTGCAPVYCSSPSIYSKGSCCPDVDKDGQCDEGEIVPPSYPFTLNQSPQQPMATEPLASPLLPKTKEGILLTISPDDDPHQGKEDAETLFIEFGDYANKNVQRFNEEVLPQLLQNYGDKIKYVFRNYPSVTNSRSRQAAEASECAAEQGKFWEYHDVLLDNVHRLSTSYLYAYATQVGLDSAQFAHCLTTHRYLDEVLADRRDGDAYYIVMTPTFFINNQKISGYKEYATIAAALEAALFDELKDEKPVTVSAKATGKAYMILEGTAALDSGITASPYSNSMDFVDASFSLAAQDITKSDSPASQDTATLTATFTKKKLNQFQEDTYTIILQDLLSEGVTHTYFGGIGTNVFLNGNTGIGTSLLPLSKAYVVLWGKSAVYKNGDLIAKDTFTNFLITTGIRDDTNHLLPFTDQNKIEAYLLLSGKYSGLSIPETDQGFIYLFWDSLDLQQN